MPIPPTREQEHRPGRAPSAHLPAAQLGPPRAALVGSGIRAHPSTWKETSSTSARGTPGAHGAQAPAVVELEQLAGAHRRGSRDHASTPAIVATSSPACGGGRELGRQRPGAGAGASDGDSHGCARSQAAAARSTRSSSKRRPAICSPSGSPPEPGAIGTLMTGCPVRLNG